MKPLKNLSYKEKRKNLITEITKKSAGSLTPAEASVIVKKLNVNIPYQLDSVNSYKKMKQILTLKRFSPDNSKLHTFFIKEYGTVLLGSASFGLLENNKLYSSPALEKNQKLVILIDQHRFNSCEGICSKLEKRLKVVIYVPGI